MLPPHLVRHLAHHEGWQFWVGFLPLRREVALEQVLAGLFLRGGRGKGPIEGLVPAEDVGHGDAGAGGGGAGGEFGREDGDGDHLDGWGVSEGDLARVEAADGLFAQVVVGLAAQHGGGVEEWDRLSGTLERVASNGRARR